jgi:hypothetical protein
MHNTSHEFIWRSMKIHEDPWRSMKIHEDPRRYMNIYEDIWIYMNEYEFSCMYVNYWNVFGFCFFLFIKSCGCEKFVCVVTPLQMSVHHFNSACFRNICKFTWLTCHSDWQSCQFQCVLIFSDSFQLRILSWHTQYFCCCEWHSCHFTLTYCIWTDSNLEPWVASTCNPVILKYCHSSFKFHVYHMFSTWWLYMIDGYQRSCDSFPLQFELLISLRLCD